MNDFMNICVIKGFTLNQQEMQRIEMRMQEK